MSGNKFELEATATLARMIRNVMKSISDPEHPERSILIRWPDKQKHFPLGTGSDFTVFIHNQGIPSADLRFTADSGSGHATAYGTYHSIYDSFSWMERYGDPGFAFHQKMSILWGVCALRLADSERLPFDHVDQARVIAMQVPLVKHMVTDSKAFKAMQSAAREYVRAAVAIKSAQRKPGDVQDEVNDRMAFSERQFLFDGGLPRRKWFKHVLQAPALYLGYTAEYIPGVVQAFRDEKDRALANEQAWIFATRLSAVAQFLETGRRIDIDSKVNEKSIQLSVQ